jgi:hypothetical protein
LSKHNPYAPKVKKTETILVEEVIIEQKLEVPEGSVASILKWVGNDKDKAKAALEAEKAGKERITLIDQLEEIL